MRDLLAPLAYGYSMKLRTIIIASLAMLLASPVLADNKISQYQQGGSIQNGDLVPVVRGCTGSWPNLQNCQNFQVPWVTQSAGVATFNTRTGSVSLSASDVGSVLFVGPASHQFLTGLSSSGVFSQAQPAFSDLAGSLSATQIPAPTTSSFGGIVALAAATAHQVVQYVNTSGQQILTQLGFSDLAGTISGAQLGSSYSNGQVLIGSASNGQLAPGTLTAGSNITITNGPGTITIGETTTSSMVYPGAGIPNSTGSGWGTPFSTSGTGNVALTVSPVFTTPNIGNATGNISGNAATVTTNANLTGDVTSVGNATTLSAGTVTGKALTGFSASAGSVSSSDTILSAFNKIVGNISGLTTGVSSVFGRPGAITAQSGDYTVSQVTGAAPLASPSFTGTVTLPVSTGVSLDLTTTGSPTATAGIYSSSAKVLDFSTSGVKAVEIASDGGMTIGSPTGGDEGTGTLNATNLYVAGAAVLTGNQTVTLSGDITGSGATSITTTTAKVHGVTYGASPSTNTVPVVTGTNTVTYETVPNAALANSSITIAGHAVSLGNSQAVACADLSNGATGCSTAIGTSGATIPLLNGTNTISGVWTFGAGDVALSGTSTGPAVFNGTTLASTTTMPAAYLPLTTSTAFGVVKPDNSTVVVASGVLSTGPSIPTEYRDYDAMMGVGTFAVWLEGGTFSTPASGTYVATLFKVLYDGTSGTFTVQQSGGPLSIGATNQLEWNQTVAGSGSTFREIEYDVEDGTTFNNDNATLSLIAKCSTGTVSATLEVAQNFGTGGSPSSEVIVNDLPITITTTPTVFNDPVAMPSTASKTFGSNFNDAVKLRIKLPATSTFDVAFSQMKFERGLVNTPFSQVPLSVILGHINRYLEFSEVSIAITPGATAAGQGVYSTIPFKTQMRRVPTVSFFTLPGSSTLNNGGLNSVYTTTYGSTAYFLSSASGAAFAIGYGVTLDARL